MPTYSRHSKSKLATAHKDLQLLFNEVIKYWDNTIICGHRNKVEQNAAYDNKSSQVKWAKSKHNKKPSMAVDSITYPVDWDDTDMHIGYAIFVLLTAADMRIDIRWGGDWDRDGDFTDNELNDLVHFELV